MRILFLSDNFWPENNAPASRTFEHCKEWVKSGADVTVLTCAPNFPYGKVYDGYRNALRQEETVDGIRVIRVWSYMAPNAGFAKRTVDFVSFAVASFCAGLFEYADVIVATSPQFFTTWSAWALSQVKRKPWIFELRDLWPESVAAVGLVRQKRLLAILERIELALYRRSAHVIALTDAFKRNLVSRGITPDKISVITNGVDLDRYRPTTRDERLVTELGLTGKFVIGYIGTHGMAHSLKTFVDAAALLPVGAHLLFIGEGAEKANISAYVQQSNQKNITLLGQVPRSEVPRYLSIADAVLVPLRKSDTFLSVIPSKMFEAAAMRVPMLLGVDGEAREISSDFESGLYFPPEDGARFCSAAARLMGEPDLYARLQRGCKTMALAYDRKVLAARMLRLLESVAADGVCAKKLAKFLKSLTPWVCLEGKPRKKGGVHNGDPIH